MIGKNGIKCIEDENIRIRRDKDNGEIIITKDDNKEVVKDNNFNLVLTDILPYIRPSRQVQCLEGYGYTLEAVKKRFEDKKKEIESKKEICTNGINL